MIPAGSKHAAATAAGGIGRGESPDRGPAPAVMLLVTGLNIGGAERVVLDLAQGYRRAGVRTVVMALADHRDLLRLVDISGLDIRFIAMRKTPVGFANAVNRLARTIRRERIAVVHAHLPEALFVATAARLFARYALIHTSHNFDFPRSKGLALRLTRGLRDVDVLLAPGQHRELNCRRSELIPNGIRLPARAPMRTPFDPAVRGARLLAVCRLTEQKNPQALIAAFAALRRDPAHAAVRLQIAGDGPLRPAVNAQVAALGLGDAVELLGMRGDVEALLAQADVFVLSSRYEGVPLAVLEAGVAGLPVVAPPIGGLPWLLGDDCGFLAEPAALAGMLDTVLRDPAEAQRRGQRLQQRVYQRFGQQTCIDAHLALYRELAAAG
ncbi:MAG: glycosyltransferase [Lautropia sp.]